VQLPSSYAIINPCFTAGKISGVRNCHAALQHQKTTIYSPYKEKQQRDAFEDTTFKPGFEIVKF
jgi:hypothetical protein